MSVNQVKQRMSNLQIMMIVLASSIAFGHFVYVHLAILYAGRDAWISLAIACAVGLAIVYSHLKFAVTTDASLTDHVLEVFGPWLGRLIGVVYIVFFMSAVALTIKVVIDFMSIIYPTTPPTVFLIAEFAVSAWCCYSGIEVMGRVMQLTLPIMIFLGVSVSLLAIPEKDFTQIYPVMSNGWGAIWLGSLVFVTMFAELVAFGVITEHSNDPKKLPGKALILVPLIFIMFLSPVTGPIMVFGEVLAKHLSFPTYTEIQYVRVGGILERLDIIGVVLWTIGSFFRIAMFTYAAVKSTSKLLNSQRTNTYTIPITVLTAALSLSLMQASREDVYHFLGGVYIYLAPSIGIGIPVVTGIVAWIRSKLGKGKQSFQRAN